MQQQARSTCRIIPSLEHVASMPGYNVCPQIPVLDPANLDSYPNNTIVRYTGMVRL